MTENIENLSDAELLTTAIQLNNERLQAEEEQKRKTNDLAEVLHYIQKERPGLRMATVASRLHLSRQRMYQIAAKFKENTNADH